MRTLTSGKGTLAISLFWLNVRALKQRKRLCRAEYQDNSTKNEQQRSLFQHSWGWKQARPLSLTKNQRRERKKSTTNPTRSFHHAWRYKWCRLIKNFMPFWRPDRGLDRMRLVVYKTADTVLLCSVGLDGEIRLRHFEGTHSSLLTTFSSDES